jgi:hypothetical protein
VVFWAVPVVAGIAEIDEVNVPVELVSEYSQMWVSVDSMGFENSR